MPAPARIDVFAPITKRERDPKTGHLYVYGKVTGPDLDRDMQGMDATWLKTAVPEWFTRGNLREQHDPKRAIGKAVELEEKTDGWYIGAKIVDKDAIEKVEEEVLTGFSIGIKGPRLDLTKADYPRGLVTGGRICETSLVDVPCLPTATIQEHWEIPLAKADDAGELRPVQEPELVRVAGPSQTTYGLPAELFDRLAAPVKQALADLAAAGADVSAALEQDAEADKADAAAPPVVVNVTVSGSVIADQALTDMVRDAVKAYDALDKAYTAEEKRAALKAGHAIPNAKGQPSYVIKTKADLRKAIKAVGRGSADHDAIRKHVLTRAKALGLEAMVPDNWNADGSLKDAEKADAATIEKAEAVLRDVRTLVPALAKADDDAAGGEDESDDIAGAQEAITAIAKLIVSEAESLAAGNLNEACDIALLLDAVRALKWFQANERNEQSGLDDMLLTDAPDLEKAKGKNGGTLAPPFKKKKGAAADADDDAEDGDGADGDDDADGDGKDAGDGKKKTAAKKTDSGELLTKAEAAEAIKAAVTEALAAAGKTETSPAEAPESVTKTELAEMIKTAVAEAKAADEERIETLTADLAKAQGAIEDFANKPIPGGPALTRTTAQQDSAVKTDAVILHAQAAELLEKAEKFAGNRDLAQGYRDRAKALLAKAAA